MTEKEALTEYFNAQENSIDMPSRNHSIVQSNLPIAFYPLRDKYRIFTELNLKLANISTIPDACIYAKNTEKIDWFEDELEKKEPPLVIIEILSPRQGMQELTEKFKQYFGAGVKSCWLIQPYVKTVMVFDKNRNNTVFTSGQIFDVALNAHIEFDVIFE